MDKKSISKTSTVTGLRQLHHKIAVKTVKALKQRGIQIDDLGKFEEFLDNGGAQLLSNKFLSNYKVFEQWSDYVEQEGFSNKEFIDIYNKYKEAGRDTAQLLDKSLEKKAKAKRKRRKKRK